MILGASCQEAPKKWRFSLPASTLCNHYYAKVGGSCARQPNGSRSRRDKADMHKTNIEPDNETLQKVLASIKAK
jgi:hypothetical protein